MHVSEWSVGLVLGVALCILGAVFAITDVAPDYTGATFGVLGAVLIAIGLATRDRN